LVFSSLFYSIKWPEIGPFWGVDLLYRRPPGEVVTGGLAAADVRRQNAPDNGIEPIADHVCGLILLHLRVVSAYIFIFFELKLTLCSDFEFFHPG
jgi:hypothetical protein